MKTPSTIQIDLYPTRADFEAVAAIQNLKWFKITRFRTSGKMYDAAYIAVAASVGIYDLYDQIQCNCRDEDSTSFYRPYFSYHLQPLGDHDFPQIVYPVPYNQNLIQLALICLAENIRGSFYKGYIQKAIRLSNPRTNEDPCDLDPLDHIAEAFGLEEAYKIKNLQDIDREFLYQTVYSYALMIGHAFGLPTP